MKFHHLNITSVSHEGETFEADEHGIIDAPAGAAEAFAAFGLLPWKESKVSGSHAPNVPAPLGNNVAQWPKDVLEGEAKRLNIDTTLPRLEMVKAVAAARKTEAEAAERLARKAELEAKPTEELTETEAVELAALKETE
jgi:hypothetical protein